MSAALWKVDLEDGAGFLCLFVVKANDRFFACLFHLRNSTEREKIVCWCLWSRGDIVKDNIACPRTHAFVYFIKFGHFWSRRLHSWRQSFKIQNLSLLISAAESCLFFLKGNLMQGWYSSASESCDHIQRSNCFLIIFRPVTFPLSIWSAEHL